LLPYKGYGFLLFCVCRSCAEQGNEEHCHHDAITKRTLTGTWVVDEVRAAVELGYFLLKIHEFYEYDVTQYDTKIFEEGHSNTSKPFSS